MADMAFTEILAKTPKDGKYWSLGMAERGVPGYTPVKETGDPADPFFVAKFPTRFDTREEAAAQATKLNAEMLGIIDPREALAIVISSMGAQNAGRGRPARPTLSERIALQSVLDELRGSD